MWGVGWHGLTHKTCINWKHPIGDIVEITGKRTTVARVMPAYAAQRGQGLIQIDGIVRANAGGPAWGSR